MQSVDIFDVTIRDGSYAIDFQFTQQDVRFLCAALERLGFRYIEVGHGFGLNGAPTKGASAVSDEESLAAAAQTLRQARFGTFFIPGIGKKEHILRARRDYGMNFIRIGDDPEKIDRTGPEYIEYARGLGYEVMANFMKSYALPPAELARKAKPLVAAGAEAVYVVDSAGGMLPDEVGEYVRALVQECGVRVGFHGHNNLELAAANSAAAYLNGGTLIDCSVGGLGRSAGNTRTEMMIPTLRRLGVTMDYDLLGVLELFERVIRPLLRRRAVTPRHILGGYARIHSGLMAPFNELSRKHGVRVEHLLHDYADALAAGAAPEPLEQMAARVAAQAPRGERIAEDTLLKVDARRADLERIKNTFGAVDDVVATVGVLAQKANLPVAALVSISPAPVSEPYLMADYLYHDDQFVMMRLLFSGVEQFEEVMRRHPNRFAALVFEELSREAGERLAASRPRWCPAGTVVYSSRAARTYHALFATVYQFAMEAGATGVLFFGGDPEEVARRVPPEMASLNYCCTAQEFGPAGRGGLVSLDPVAREVRRGPVGEEPTFQVGVILSPADRADVEAMLDRLPPAGVVIDCVRLPAECEELVRQSGRRLVHTDLHRALSAELAHLLEVARRQPTLAEERPAADAVRPLRRSAA